MSLMVLDASVIAKWYNEEEYRDKTIKIRDRFIDGLLNIKKPLLVIYKVANAINKNTQLSVEDAVKAVGSLMRLMEGVVELLSERI